MSLIISLDSDQLLILASLLSIVIAEDLTVDEMNIIGNLVVSIGSLILTKAAQEAAQQMSVVVG